MNKIKASTPTGSEKKRSTDTLNDDGMEKE